MTQSTPTSTAQSPGAGYPGRSARTQRFTLGAPRSVQVSADGATVLFLRSRAGDDRTTCLWRVDPATGEETLVADPRALAGVDDGTDELPPEELPPEEQARRERLREAAGGIVAYATDRSARIAAFALSGQLWLADVAAGTCRVVQTEAAVMDPRPSPDGRLVAFVTHGALHVVPADGSAAPRRLVGPGPDEAEVSWGLAEFVAAEEMNRFRGYWWSPDSDALLVTRVDEEPVHVWHLADPANPGRPPRAIRYPAAGTPNADVTLWAVSLGAAGSSAARGDAGAARAREVRWDRDLFPYLTTVSWTDRGAPLLQVMDRAQQHARVLTVTLSDPTANDEKGPNVRSVGRAGPCVPTSVRREIRDESSWVEVVAGSPTWSSDGRLLTVEAVGGATSLFVDARPVTDESLQLRGVVHVDDAGAVVVAAPTDDPTEQHAWRVPLDGSAPQRLAPDAGPYGTVVLGGATAATSTVVSSTADWDRASRVEVRTPAGTGQVVRSHAEEPTVTPRPRVVRSRVRGIVTAVYLPTGHEEGTPLPVLMSPYGGPHAQRVVAARNAHLESQWLADQGFAVVVADGRGTPRTPSWERAVRLDLAAPVLEDQVEALETAAEHVPDLDRSRVGIRGWSFGGYLAALAVLRRPDTFHAAVAGAPVTDWRLYDTFYTERYLGLPDSEPDAYSRSSLLADAHRLERPLLLIHGLADDNVVAAHTLQLSSALLAAGRPHEVLPLSGVTHMTPQEVVAENLLHLQLDFLRRHLGAE